MLILDEIRVDNSFGKTAIVIRYTDTIAKMQRHIEITGSPVVKQSMGKMPDDYKIPDSLYKERKLPPPPEPKWGDFRAEIESQLESGIGTDKDKVIGMLDESGIYSKNIYEKSSYYDDDLFSDPLDPYGLRRRPKKHEWGKQDPDPLPQKKDKYKPGDAALKQENRNLKAEVARLKADATIKRRELAQMDQQLKERDKALKVATNQLDSLKVRIKTMLTRVEVWTYDRAGFLRDKRILTGENVGEAEAVENVVVEVFQEEIT